MREQMLRKLKQNKAFTLMEMMITVAILVVFLAIGVLNISNWTKTLTMSKLDGYAKTIYLEAQHQFASMDVEGGLPHFYSQLVDPDGIYVGRFLTDMPSDYEDNGNTGEKWNEMCYFMSSDDIVTEFIPSFSFVNDDTGQYLIELDPITGEIYGVFYWENDNESVPTLTTEVYSFLKGMRTAENDSNNRELASRTEVEIGYYGGIVSDTTVVTEYELNQETELRNEEELYAVVSYDYKGKMVNFRNSEEFTITFTIDDEDDSTDSLVYVVDGKNADAYVTPDFKRIEFAVLLDSVVGGYDMKSLSEGYYEESGLNVAGEKQSLHLGDDITVKVETVFWYGDLYLVDGAEDKKPEKNSLYDNVVDDTISVANVRHLKNIAKADFDITGTEQVKIKQSADIDFSNINLAFDYTDGNITYVGAGNSTASILSLEPIKNDSLLMLDSLEVMSGKTVTVDGNGKLLKNFVISSVDSTSAGLFAEAQNITFNNIKIVDSSISASVATNVGAMIGTVTKCNITNCGAYLTSYYRDLNGNKCYYSKEPAIGAYPNRMEENYATYSVTGASNVGGLIGSAVNSTISQSFAAVKVNGANHTGGFVGNASASTTINNCYASGDVAHTADGAEYIGGFIGYSDSITVNNAYASGDVLGSQLIGGFVGGATNSLYGYCFAYGEVLNRAGIDSFAEGIHAGGFISARGNSGSDVVWLEGGVSSCRYLQQLGYNSHVSDLSEYFAQTYVNLTAGMSGATLLETGSTFAYDEALTYKAFPFVTVTGSHYGNFPLQFTINNSLVYYEKYEGGGYGYYCVTTLDGDEEEYVWVLDSLRDDTYCIEDGYALLSMYYLEEVNYKVYQYVDETDNNTDDGSWVSAKKGENDSTPVQGTLYSSTTTPGEDKMVFLSQQGVLEFDAYTPINTATESTYTADYSGAAPKSSFSISGMYMYQLPYDLQNTYRYDVDNFYDVIVFDEGYAKGNSKEDNGTPVIEDLVYYYCPHFSKLAVNPGVGVSGSANTDDFEKLTAPYTVYVRSARQLNRLGRVPYYWNANGGGSELMTYEQELDIDFGKYTKEYCGEPYNLLAFDTDYANQPIGQCNGDTTGYGVFSNDYKGNYHKIIDYCVKSDLQYVGLFGEIYKEEGATQAQIRDVVMVLSDEPQGNAGLIIGTFQEKDAPSNNANRKRTGVGALVGSDYTIGATSGQADVFTIYNCASAGYKVQYHLKNERSNSYKQPLGIAVGGLIGYSRGNIQQCSATNDVKLIADTTLSGGNSAVFLGGFAGSCFYGTIMECYSGGSIDVTSSKAGSDGSDCHVNRLRIGGFCPGWLYAPGVSNNAGDEKVRYANVYAYTAISENVWKVGDDNGTFTFLIPCVGRMKVDYEYGSWTTQAETGDVKGVRAIGYSYYLNSVYTDEIIDRIPDGSNGCKRFFEAQKNILGFVKEGWGKTCDPISYTNLSNTAYINNAIKDTDEVTVDVDYAKKSYPYTSTGTYPFPAVVVNENGELVHYGDWPAQP